MKKLLFSLLLCVASLAQATSCQTFAAGDTNYISKLNLLANGCAAVVGADSLTLIGTAGAGFVQIANQSSAPSTPTSAGRIYFDSTNRLSWKGTNGFVRTLDGIANTANRVYNLQDRDGTIADSTDLATKAALAGSSSQPFATAGLTTSGNITLSGSARRIIGDFSSSPTSDRTLLQTSTANGFSDVVAIPNGTGTLSQFSAYSSSDPANSSLIGIRATASGDAKILSTKTGTGTLLPITVFFGAAEALRIHETTFDITHAGTTDATSLTAAAVKTAGGLAVAKKLYVGSDSVFGYSAATNALRYFDVQNTDTGSSAGSIFRLISSNVAASGNTSADIIKYKNGTFYINNNEPNAGALIGFGIGGTQRLTISSNGDLASTGIVTATGYKLSALQTAPASAAAAGTTGTIIIDANHIYICVATNSWKRVAIAAW